MPRPRRSASCTARSGRGTRPNAAGRIRRRSGPDSTRRRGARLRPRRSGGTVSWPVLGMGGGRGPGADSGAIIPHNGETRKALAPAARSVDLVGPRLVDQLLEPLAVRCAAGAPRVFHVPVDVQVGPPEVDFAKGRDRLQEVVEHL